jgi:hypothetical protein
MLLSEVEIRRALRLLRETFSGIIERSELYNGGPVEKLSASSMPAAK